MVMETASPPVSPKVVATILMIQKPRVTWGTLLSISLVDLVMGEGSITKFPNLPSVQIKGRGVSHGGLKRFTEEECRGRQGEMTKFVGEGFGDGFNQIYAIGRQGKF